MISSTPKTQFEDGEPSSYRLMENALARVVTNGAEETGEACAPSSPNQHPQTKEEGTLGVSASNSQMKQRSTTNDSLLGSSTNLPKTQTPIQMPQEVSYSVHLGEGAARDQTNGQESVGASSGASLVDGLKGTSADAIQSGGSELKVASSGDSESEGKATMSSSSPHAPIAPASETLVYQGLRVPLRASPQDSISPQDHIGPPRLIHTEISTGTPGASPSDSPSTLQISPSRPSSNGSNSMPQLRRGKWTVEEEAYVARVIQDFNSGFLNAPAGTTLRSYLSDKLRCDPMRITKKFTGDACIGKRVFHPAVRSIANATAIDKAQAELDALERRWRRRLEMQHRDSAKKAAASAAAANSATSGGGGHTMIQGVPVVLLSSGGHDAGFSAHPIGQNVVTQAASWLDRANAILKGAEVVEATPSAPPTTTAFDSLHQTAGEAFESMPNVEIENQMKEVQRLIFEGPLIQQHTAGLPNLLSPGQSTSDTNPPISMEPADKRLRTGGPISGAEDAEALVGFLRSVRASAASGQDL